ncbi:MAG: hypothetical protein WCR08_12145 [Gammaproteobacteria bacterium]
MKIYRRKLFFVLVAGLLTGACTDDEKRELDKIVEKAKELLASEAKKQADAKIQEAKTNLIDGAKNAVGLGPSDAAVSRAKIWVDRKVKYSLVEYYNTASLERSRTNSDAKQGWYRTDCSGFISYAWDIGTSPDTATIHKKYTINIPFTDLKPGDVINSNPQHAGIDAHIVMFVKWLNKEKHQFLAYEQVGEPGLARDYKYTIQPLDPKDPNNLAKGYDLLDEYGNKYFDQHEKLRPWFTQRITKPKQ